MQNAQGRPVREEFIYFFKLVQKRSGQTLPPDFRMDFMQMAETGTVLKVRVEPRGRSDRSGFERRPY